MKPRHKKQIVVNKIIEQPKPKKEPVDWSIYLNKANKSWISIQNFFIFLFNKLFRLRMLVLMGAVSAASIDYFLITSNITTTYHDLGQFASFMAIGILFSLIVTEIILFHPFKYRPSVAPKSSRSQNLKVAASAYQKILAWEKREKFKRIGHYTKWGFLKSIIGFVFFILVLINLNFSYSELTAAIGKDAGSYNKITQQSSLINIQIEDYNNQIESAKKTRDGWNPETHMTKRADAEKVVSELSKLRDDKIEELKNLQSNKRKDSLVEKPIHYTYLQLKELVDISMEKYVSIVNFLLAVSITSLYLFLTYVFTALKDNEDIQVVKVRKVIKRRK